MKNSAEKSSHGDIDLNYDNIILSYIQQGLGIVPAWLVATPARRKTVIP